MDIKGEIETVNEAVANPDSPAVANLGKERLREIERILEKREAGLTIMPEEFSTISQFAVQIERAAHAEREERREARRQELAEARNDVPARYFRMGIELLELPAPLLNTLKPMQTIGELQTRFNIDADPLRHLLERVDEEIVALQQQIRASLALVEFAMPEEAEAAVAEPAAEDAESVEEELAAPAEETAPEIVDQDDTEVEAPEVTETLEGVAVSESVEGRIGRPDRTPGTFAGYGAPFRHSR